MRKQREKQEKSLPPLIQENLGSHIFGKASVDVETDIRVGKLVNNEFNRDYLEDL